VTETFDEAPAERPPSRRSRALVITAVVLVVAFFGLTTFASFYTNVLWYRSIDFGSVYSRLIWTRVGLFLVFGLLMAAAVAASMVVAFRTRPLFHPQSPEQNGLDRYRQAVTPIRTWLVVGLAALFGIFAGTSGSGQWRTYLLWRNGVPFERKDAYFGKDIGFFVFDLPWYHFLVDFVMAATVIALLAAAVVHYLYGGIRLQSAGDRLSGAAQAQLSVLLGIFVLAKSLDYWLDRYDLAHHKGSRLTGITYTDQHAVLPAKAILAGIALICAVLFFLNVWRRTWLLPSMGLALLVLSAILLGLIWPGIVQQFQVRPSEADKESTYIAKNIAATRAAYDIDSVAEYALPSGDDADSTQPTGDSPEVSSIPVVDPKLVHSAFEQLQQVRGYYSVADVLDVDHYEINGVDRAVVLGARELDQQALNADARSWSNLHTVYTHGNDVIAAFANQRDKDDQTVDASGTDNTDKTQWAEGSQASQDLLTAATGGYEDKVYFGENSPDYSVVGKASASSPDVELDLPRSAAAASNGNNDDSDTGDTTTYAGKGGVPIGSTFRQLMYAIKFGSTNFLLSGRVNDNSQILYDRDPKQRVQKAAPWLTLDDDVYPAVVDNRIVWILDGYTTTDKFPGSELDSFKEMTDDTLQDNTGLRTLPTDDVNYMRNSVKATVDAYDGTVTLYAWDEADPILKAWSAAFPGTVKPRADIPPELMDHLRYPEDMFKVQRYQYARYHVTDPQAWFQDNNRWEVPTDPNQGAGATTLQPPYRMFVTQPTGMDRTDAGAKTDPDDIPAGQTWSMTSSFVPYKRNNLAAYVSVDSDANSPTYGRLRVIDVLDAQQPGPGQVANTMQTNNSVADQVQTFRLSDNTLSYGNLLTVPVGDQLMYVEPVYAAQASGSDATFPILRFVIVYYNQRVGIATNLGAALDNARAGSPSTTNPTTGPSTGPSSSSSPSTSTSPSSTPSGSTPTGYPSGGTVDQLLAYAQDQFTAADAALSQQDLSEYQRHIDNAQKAVNEALSRGSSTLSQSTPSTPSSASSSVSPES
jgi:uncharacterized protein